MESVHDPEYDDPSHRISQVLMKFSSDLYVNDSFRRAVIAILVNREGAQVPRARIDELHAHVMTSISPRERETAIAELHGVVSFPGETRALVADAVDAVDAHLQRMPALKTAAYRLCLEKNPEYATDLEFRLMFLRSTSFQAILAAERLALFFTLKLELFGIELLARDVKPEDLSQGARDILQTCFLQPLPNRDRCGRLVLVSHALSCTRTSLMEALWFRFMSAVKDDVLSQIRGVVLVGYNVGPNRFVDHRVWRDMNFCVRALPIRIASHHQLEGGQESLAFMIYRCFMLPATRIRFRQYFGNSVENYHHELRRYGIPIRTFYSRNACEEKLVSQTMRHSLMEQALLGNPNAQQLLFQTTKTLVDFSKEAPAPRTSAITAHVQAKHSWDNQTNVRAHGYDPSAENEFWSSVMQIDDSGDPSVSDVVLSQTSQLAKLPVADNPSRAILTNDTPEYQLIGELIGKNNSPQHAKMHEKQRKEAVLETAAKSVTNNGSKDLSGGPHKQKKLSTQSSSFSTSGRIYEVRNNDVLFGRGKSRFHIGNVLVQAYVQEFYSEYEKASKGRKTEIADMVVSKVRESGGRFLKLAEDFNLDDFNQGGGASGGTKCTGGYMEASHFEARRKIGRFFKRKKPGN